MHLLVFGDDPDCRALQPALRASGHDVILHDRARLQRVPWRAIDACDGLIVSLARPASGVCEIIRHLRRGGVNAPVLLLAGSDDMDDICAGLDAGAADYVIDSTDPDAVLTRMRILIRRAAVAPVPILAFQGLEMDRIGHVVRRDAVPVDLTTTEFRLLEQLLLHPGAVVTRDELLDTVWCGELSPDSNVVDVHIANLRRKLRAHGATPLIRTVRGVGYVLDGGTAPGPAGNGRDRVGTCRCGS